jgi:hypothetical protein
MPYYVNSASVTPDEPSPGWYYTREDDDGVERIVGPFGSKHEALDDESDGAYSEWLESKREDNYERDLIDAGRGHLLRR